ncbi:MacS family sensor histidine kinase [Klenkia brasiliensis]|uniref:Histidine kinase-, DNA gyrase B-, and HSP90-like ATPase n=1 Tax=Klenkia brasiliensis TaxID=333142 RepID=A0A1G7MBU4_9ACTN|nr:ATP-binding protein [Klenkia brasiliensis]SDF59116.1 Histidine kinase-, DNA gyrase B-, and HSP90-like ATPase [Klenkia brasiliensis]
MTAPGGPPVRHRDLLAPLWRVVVAFRLVTWVVAVLGWFRERGDYPGIAAPLAVLGAMAVWTGVVTVLYSRASGRRVRTTLLDLGVTVLLLAATVTTQPAGALGQGAPIVTSIWVAGPALAMALVRGRLGGLAGALVVWAAVTTLRGYVGDREVFNLTLLVLVSVLLGHAATITGQAETALREAAAAQAAAAERERLGRAVHDGVLQVLVAVRRRARSSAELADLGRLAAEQEVALRGLLTTGAPVAVGTTDLGTALRLLATPDVEVSGPAEPVEVPAHTGGELVAAVREALANTAGHAPGARAWVSLEPADDEVVVVVRDDGPGIPEGRLPAAEQEGHHGVRSSICGRLADLGGSAVLRTGPGQGTEWELTVPREGER